VRIIFTAILITPLKAYASWFLQNRPGDQRERCARITPKWRQFPIISSSLRPCLTPAYIPEQPQNCISAGYHICCSYFFLDTQGEFLYSPSPEKQVLINEIKSGGAMSTSPSTGSRDFLPGASGQGYSPYPFQSCYQERLSQLCHRFRHSDM
jgi:hypothetical protein